ncbi:MAG: hypothetical protein OEY03_00435 [Rhizobacter sp.]|nr:hypothetical protein [Rhizobacter sp.]
MQAIMMTSAPRALLRLRGRGQQLATSTSRLALTAWMPAITRVCISTPDGSNQPK